MGVAQTAVALIILDNFYRWIDGMTGIKFRRIVRSCFRVVDQPEIRANGGHGVTFWFDLGEE